MQSIRECGIYKAGQLLQQQLASECVVLPAKRGVAKHPNFAKQNMCESSRAQRHKQHSVTVAKELPCPYASCSTERYDYYLSLVCDCCQGAILPYTFTKL